MLILEGGWGGGAELQYTMGRVYIYKAPVERVQCTPSLPLLMVFRW